MGNNHSLIFILLFGLLSFFLIKPVFSGIISAFFLAYLLLPAFRLFSRKLPSSVSAIFAISLVLIVLFSLTYFFSSIAIEEAKQFLEKGDVGQFRIQQLIPFIPNQLSSYASSISENINKALTDFTVRVASEIPGIAFQTLVTFFLTYYLLLNWRSVSVFIISLIPFYNKEEVAERIGFSARNIVYGYLIVGFIDFLVSLIGFWLAGVKLYAFLALLVGTAAFVPYFGPATVWIPLFIVSAISGNYYSAAVILVTGLITTIVVDHFFSFYIVGKKSDINPAIMMVGVIGGVAVFGALGFIAGPVALLAFIEFLKEYSKNRM